MYDGMPLFVLLLSIMARMRANSSAWLSSAAFPPAADAAAAFRAMLACTVF